MDDSKLKQTRNLFKKLINDQNNVFYSADKISRMLLNRSIMKRTEFSIRFINLWKIKM